LINQYRKTILLETKNLKMDLPTETITSETINQFVNVVKNMTSNDATKNNKTTETAKTDETKPPSGGADCDIKNNYKKRRTHVWEFTPAPRGVCPFGTTSNVSPSVPPHRAKHSLDLMLAKPLMTMLETSNDILVGLKRDGDYRLQRRKDLDARRDNVEFNLTNENFFGSCDKVVTENTAGYTAGYVIQTFLNTSTNPKLFSASSIDVLNPNDFNTRTSSLITNAEFVLGELHIDPYTRMSGQFHIRNVRTLRDALMTRMHPGHLAVLDGAAHTNTVDRDTLITYAAEMNFINNQADGLVDFINSLVN
jgi:hypothetical protein